MKSLYTKFNFDLDKENTSFIAYSIFIEYYDEDGQLIPKIIVRDIFEKALSLYKQFESDNKIKTLDMQRQVWKWCPVRNDFQHDLDEISEFWIDGKWA